jgi:ferritin-like metal-binding protein YciE
MKLETLKDLYIHELKDLYSAEKQIIKALPKMVKAATNKQLAAGFEEHFEQTKEHVARLEKILTSHDESTRGPKCEGMEGLIKEGDGRLRLRPGIRGVAGGSARCTATSDYPDRRIRYRQKANQVGQIRDQRRG